MPAAKPVSVTGAVATACGRLRLAIEAAAQIVQIGRESRNLSLAFEGMYNLGVMHAWHGNAARAAQSFPQRTREDVDPPHDVVMLVCSSSRLPHETHGV